MTHPAFRQPRHSGWGFDEGRKLTYRRIDGYLGEMAVPMKSLGGGPPTRSFHRPISAYINAFAEAGFATDAMLELPDLPPIAGREPPRAATPAPTPRSRSSWGFAPFAGDALSGCGAFRGRMRLRVPVLVHRRPMTATSPNPSIAAASAAALIAVLLLFGALTFVAGLAVGGGGDGASARLARRRSSRPVGGRSLGGGPTGADADPRDRHLRGGVRGVRRPVRGVRPDQGPVRRRDQRRGPRRRRRARA